MADDLRAAARTLTLLARTLERAAGDLSLAQYRVLALVTGGDERATLLAERLAVAKPTVSAVVDGLVERGLLERGPVDGDRRAVRLAVTPAGRAAVGEAEAAMAERLDRLFADVSDRDALLAGLAEVEATWAAAVRRRIEGARA